MHIDDVIIVLSRVSEAGNVGAVCRAMKNSGLSRLRLAKPEFSDTPSLSEAGLSYGGAEAVIRARSVHAFDIWENARTFDSLADAVEDCSLVIGTTHRRGHNRKQSSMTPEEAAALLKNANGKAAIVFGNERTGLDAEEIAVCNLASHIPSSEAFPSLNLSHAVMIYAYELFKTLSDQSQSPVQAHQLPLPQGKIHSLVQRITNNLESIGFYKQRGRKEQEEFLQDLISRAALTECEAAYLAGIIEKSARLAAKAAGKESKPDEFVH